MSYKGADVEALTTLATAMLTSKADVESALARAKSDFANLPWQGPDRDRYVAEWGQHESVLRQLCTGLEHAAHDAFAHAKAQEQTSSNGW